MSQENEVIFYTDGRFLYTVREDLKTHDPRVVTPVLLHEVELLGDYRDPRHAPPWDEGWQDPRQR